jgi:hypothetical protein
MHFILFDFCFSFSFKFLGQYPFLNKHIKHVDKFVAGAGAGVTAVMLTYPLDTIRARLAFQVTGEHRYTGIVHTAVSIFKHVSIGGFIKMTKR